MGNGDEKDGSAVAARDASKTSRGSSDVEDLEKDNERTQMGQAPLAGMDMDPTGGFKDMDAIRKVIPIQREGRKHEANTNARIDGFQYY